MDKKREERVMNAIANIQRSKLNEYYGKVREDTMKLKIERQALKEFKVRTGLVGKELQEAWKKYWDRENNRPYENSESESEEEEKPVKKRGRPKKEYKEISVMKAKSDLVKSGDKWAVETNMNIRPTIDDKVKRALKKSVIGEINRQLKGIERGEGIIHPNQVSPDNNDDEDEIYKLNSSELYSLKRLLSEEGAKLNSDKKKLDKYNESLESQLSKENPLAKNTLMNKISENKRILEPIDKRLNDISKQLQKINSREKELKDMGLEQSRLMQFITPTGKAKRMGRKGSIQPVNFGGEKKLIDTTTLSYKLGEKLKRRNAIKPDDENLSSVVPTQGRGRGRPRKN